MKMIMKYAEWNKEKLGTAIEYLKTYLPKSGVRVLGKYVRLERELKEYKEKNIKGIFDDYLNYNTLSKEVKLTKERKKEILLELIERDSTVLDSIKLGYKELAKESLIEESEVVEKKGKRAITTTEITKYLKQIGYIEE